MATISCILFSGITTIYEPLHYCANHVTATIFLKLLYFPEKKKCTDEAQLMPFFDITENCEYSMNYFTFSYLARKTRKLSFLIKKFLSQHRKEGKQSSS